MLLIHYLKVAFRTSVKYKQQTAISVVGLAVGLVCFALSLFWIKYERGYDSFQPERDRIFRIATVDSTEETGMGAIVSPVLAPYLQQTVPEVAAASNFESYAKMVSNNDSYSTIYADSAFFNVLQVNTLLGNCNHIFADKNNVILSRSKAMKTYGNIDVLGQTFDKRYRVCAVVEDWPSHTNFPLEVIQPRSETRPEEKKWYIRFCSAYVRLTPEANIDEARKKIESLLFTREQDEGLKIKLIPLSELHYSRVGNYTSVKYQHVQIFAAMGALVIICTLINFIVLFISRLRMRGKELVLRKVNGASNGNLMLQLISEIVLIMFMASLLGAVGVEWILPHFKKIAEIEMETRGLFLQILGYFLATVTLLSLITYLPITYYRKQVFMQYLHATQSAANKYLFRRISLMMQLIIAIGFIFCMSIFVRQIYHLTHSHLGFERKNIGTMVCYSATQNEWATLPVSEVQSLSAIEQFTTGTPFFPSIGSMEWNISRRPDEELKKILVMDILPNYLDLLDIKLLQGSVSDVKDDRSVLINETAARYFGLDMDQNNHFYQNDEPYTVVGIARDFYFESPLLPVRPLLFKLKEPDANLLKWFPIIYKYADGQRSEAENQIKALYQKHNIDIKYGMQFYSMEEEYDDLFQSEQVLLVLLVILSAVCVIVSLFGVYSMVSLTNEQRRKEMAVRKAHGASVRTILLLFLREYLWVTVVASLFAFPLGYLIMQPWLELYSNRIAIGFWIYPLILAVVAAAVILTVLTCVWKTAHINPAQELKKE